MHLEFGVGNATSNLGWAMLPRIFGGKCYLDFWVEILSLISGGKCFLEFSVGNATSNLGWKNAISNLEREMLPRISGGK